MAKAPPPEEKVVSLKVTLRGPRPPIWRRLLMPKDATLADLHEAIQAAMPWQNAHLHMFRVGEHSFGDTGMFDGLDDELEDERAMTLKALLIRRVKRFAYVYDLGDDWDHDILIEGEKPMEKGRAYPACTGGRRAAPPEDCGGPWGYLELLEALENPDDPNHAETLDWLGGSFDPAAFSVKEAEAALRARFDRR